MSATASIGSWLDARAATHGSRDALLTADAAATYRELDDLATRRARQFAALGISKATRVGLLMPNRIEWLGCAFAALKLGAIVVPLNTLWQRAELEYALRFADVSLLVMTGDFLRHDYAATLVEICPSLATATSAVPLFLSELPALRHVVAVDANAPQWAIPLDGLRAHGSNQWLAAAQATVCPDDPAIVFFTSGTTATPKGAVHTQRSILTAANHVAERLGLDANDRIWGYLPFFFTGGFIAVALATLSRGGAVLLQETFDAGAAIDLMVRHHCTTFFAWPHQAEAIIAHRDFSRSKLGLRKGPGAQAAWAERIFIAGHQSVGTWGMTETGPMATCSRFDDPLAVRAGAHGRAMPGLELRIVNPDTQELLPGGEEGELLVRGPSLMDHYYKMSRAECFDGDGFFHSGDLASLDADGLLHFVGRIKDVIKTAGVNVAAAEVEAVLQQHPAVKIAYVVGIPHTTRGENVAAFVVLDQSAECKPDDLARFCRQRLATYKVPRLIRIGGEDEVPILGSGKVDKKRLRERLVSESVKL